MSDKPAQEFDFVDNDIFRTIFENNGFATAIVGEDMIISLVNTKFEKIMEYSKDETEGKKSWTDLFAAEEVEKGLMHYRERRINPDSAPEYYETKFLNKYGESIDVYVSVTMIPGTGISINSFLDITKRKKTEEVIETERRRLFNLLDKLPVLVALHAPGHKISFSNSYYQKNICKPGLKKCYEAVYGRNEPCKQCRTYSTLQDGEPAEWESVLGNKNYHFYSYLMYDIDGSPMVLQLGIDNTEQKQAEKSLRESESQLRRITDNMLDMVAQFDTKGRYAGQAVTAARTAGPLAGVGGAAKAGYSAAQQATPSPLPAGAPATA